MKTPDYRTILLRLCGSLTLCDHMGDVCGDVFEALKQAMPEVDFDAEDMPMDLSDLGTWLGKNHGVTTLHETPLYDPEEDDA